MTNAVKDNLDDIRPSLLPGLSFRKTIFYYSINQWDRFFGIITGALK